MEPGTDSRRYRAIGIAGSLRQGSLNKSLLRTLAELAPATLRIDIRDLADLPLYNQDVEDAGSPQSVVALRDAVRSADALLLVTPEYNHGAPGVLKNAIDWLSRPVSASVLNRKAAAVLGASPGMTGTARAQEQVRQSLGATNTFVLQQPEILVARAREKFDSAGRLTDEATRKFLVMFLDEFASWIARVSA